eukprot:721786_1
MVDIRLSFATILRRAQTEDNGAKDTPLITVYPMQAHQAQNHGLLNASAHQIRPSPTPRRINISARYHLIHFNDDGCKVQNCRIDTPHQAQNHGISNAKPHPIRPSPTPRRINISARYHLIHFNDDGCKVQNCLCVHRGFVDVLREYQSDYNKSTDVNVRNIGKYLKDVLDVYVTIDDQTNPYVMRVFMRDFANSARKCCETVTNFFLKEKSAGLTLFVKIQQLAHDPAFPQQKMHFIRLWFNQGDIGHSVKYNEVARDRYIPKKGQNEIISFIYDITRLVNEC